MFFKIAGFELRYQLRQPVFWAVAILFFLLAFGTVAVEQIHAGDTANVHRNSTYAIIQTTLIMSLFFMFVTAAFVSNVIVRDDETGFGPIVRATRLTKFNYLYGRFVGAYLAACIAFLAVPLALFLGAAMPWVDPQSLGPPQFTAYAYAYLVFGLPALLLTSALFFAIASITRSTIGTYIGVVAFMIAYTVARIFSAKPEWREITAYVEPFGFGAFTKAARYWTASERNTLLPALEGPLVWNRAIILGVALCVLAAVFQLFKFEVRGAKGRKAQKLAALADSAPSSVLGSGPLPKPVFDASGALAQLLARTRFDMAQVFRSPAFLVLMVLGMFNSVGALFFIGDFYGASPYPVTRLEIEGLRSAFILIPWIIAVFYAGELVWRDRDRKTHEIIDATAAPDWSFLIPKTLAIALVLMSTFVISSLTAIVVQTIKGYFHYELVHYLLWYILPETIQAVLLAALAVFLQSILPNKFLGWGAMLVFLVATIIAGALGLDDNLYIYAGTPPVPLSDMNGLGKFWEAQAWFQAYWGAFALILLVLAYGLWRRGTEVRLKPRIQRLRTKLQGAPAVVLAGAVTAFVAIGVFCFVNTHIWNTYRTNLDDERRLADYEKALVGYEKLPQPTITDVTLNVELHPHAPEALTHGVYGLLNTTTGPISDIHVRTDLDTAMTRAVIPGAVVRQSWPQFHYVIYHLAQPLVPGARTTLTFDTWRGQKGFKNDGYGTRIVDNGAFLNNFEMAPGIGMTRDQLLTDPAKRRKYGLKPEQLRLPKLTEAPAARSRNYVGAAWVKGDVTVSTDADQTPIAPGYKVSDVTSGGRRTARFRTEAPILNFFSVQSGRYAEKHALYKGVDVSVYYDAKHPWNVDRMIHAAEAGLDYYQSNFSPYQFRQYRSIEFPAYATFAQSFANTIPWSESLGFIGDMRNPDKIDYISYVGDHELGHQWWAHQVVGAQMQGETSLSETLAQYSAMMVMEKLYGKDKIRRFLKYELDTYLSARGGERIEELPLAKNENQGYIHYNKGAVVMYLLKDQIGEDKVNAALRRLLGAFAFKGPPYPTSLDLLGDLRAEAPADAQGLITDLFEKITLWDVKATKVETMKRADGKWDVRLTVSARKVYADGKGKETPTPMTNESYDFGLFSAKPGEGAFGASNVILYERRPLSSGTHVFTFLANAKPTWAGVDPYNKRIDRNSDDNLIAVDR